MLLEPSEKRRGMFLLILILITAFIDMMGIASVLPFIAVLTNPSIIETNVFLSYLYKESSFLGVNTLEEFLFILGIGVFIILIISLTFRALTTYGQMRFTLMQEYVIGRKLVEGYLNQPYSWFLDKNSADIGKSVLSDVKEIIDRTILSLLNIIVHGTTVITLLILLIIVDTSLALSVGFVLSITYGIIFLIMKNLLSRIGIERTKVNTERFKIVLEAFSATKDVKVRGLENEYTDRFSESAEIYAKNQSLADVISALPRYFIEAIAFGGMIILVLFLISSGNSFVNIIPLLVLYAFAGYRLIPSLQIIYSSSILMRFMGPTLDLLIKDLVNLKKIEKNFHEDASILNFNKFIKLKNIHFSYLNSDREALTNINLTLPRNKKIGIVGSTGSGKTTMVDLILGLLDPSKGSISIDGLPITNKNKRSWQRKIGYVPQNIFLSDCSILENIALGIDKKNIDTNAAIQAAKIANLHDFIMTDLPEGYKSRVGERGVKLSGGQRQRIGIARALYAKPQLLILDESTSALDNITEKVVMEAIHNLGDKVTVIMIAHRLNTVRNCDAILVLDQGTLQAQGTYDELTQSNDIFKKMSEINL